MTKFNILFFTCIAALLMILATGCDSSAAQRRLATDAAKLSESYVIWLLNKHIADNKHELVYSITPRQIFLISPVDTVIRTAPTRYPGLIQGIAARSYLAADIRYDVPQISWGELVKVRGRYKYRCAIHLQIQLHLRVWENSLGRSINTVHITDSKDENTILSQIRRDALKHLLPPRYDYNYLYKSSVPEKTHSINETLFVVYDAGQNQWCWESEDIARSVAVNAAPAEWLDLQLPADLPVYKNNIYLPESLRILKQYESGWVYWNNRWVTRRSLTDTAEVKKYLQNFNINRASIGDISALMQVLNRYPDAINLPAAHQIAIQAAANLIDQLSDDLKLDELQSFTAVVNGQDFQPIVSAVLPKLDTAVASVKARLNKTVEMQIQSLQDTLSPILKIAEKQENINRQQLQIITVRFLNTVKTLMPDEYKKIEENVQIFRMTAGILINDLDYVNTLYQLRNVEILLRKVEKQFVSDCKYCRQGKVACADCDSDGKCLNCSGRGWINEDLCQECRGTSRCKYCKGTRRVKCSYCSGRGFLIDRKRVELLLQQIVGQLETLINEKIRKLEAQKK